MNDLPEWQRWFRCILSSLSLLALCTAAGNARAQEFTVYAALTTDYVYRGISYSDEHAAAQLAIDVSGDAGFFGGVWASTTDLTSGTRNRSLEVDYYIGYVRYFDNDWSTSLSVNRYTYPGGDGNVDYDYNELAAVFGFDDRLWFELDYTDSLFGHDEAAYNVEVSASWPLPSLLTFSTSVGYYDVSETAGNGYSHWQVGISRPLAWLSVDLRYHDTSNVPARISPAHLADSRIALTLSAAF